MIWYGLFGGKYSTLSEHGELMAEQQRFNDLLNQFHENGQLITACTMLQRSATLWPERIALICGDQSLSYYDLYLRAVHCSIQLKERGIGQNDRVLLVYENSIEFFVAYFGAWQCGAIIAPLNTFLKSQELQTIIADAQPQCIIASAIQQEKLASLPETLPLLYDINQLSLSCTPAQARDFAIPSQSPDSMTALLYTSGTTGVPKGVMLSNRNIITNIAQGLARLDATAQGSVLCALPLFHVFMQLICVWGAIFLGATIIIVPKIDRRALIKGLSYQPELILGVPALYGLFCRMKTLDFSNVRYFISGGDALPDKIRLYFGLLYRRKLCNGYGLTETSPVIAIDCDDVVAATNTVGKPVVGVACQLRDEEGKTLTNGIGTLWVKGDNIMLGYYHAPEATAHVLQDGWFNTGDLAYFDPEGKLVICGRDKDLIVNKGIKIYPQEVENILMSHPAVFMAGVVGKSDGDGQIPVAFVAVQKESPDLADELTALCLQALARYKVPRQIIIRSELPMTTTGKVDKKALRHELQNNN